jgi:cell division septation protein DedD
LEGPESAGSRLCTRCQGLVQTILPQDSSAGFTSADSSQPFVDPVVDDSTEEEDASEALNTQPLALEEEVSIDEPLLAEVRAAATGSLAEKAPSAPEAPVEYSSTREWPLMVGAHQQQGGVFSDVSRFRLPILIAVLMAAGVAAYFLVYRPYLSAAQSESVSINGGAGERNGAKGEVTGSRTTAQAASDSQRPAVDGAAQARSTAANPPGAVNSADGARDVSNSAATQGNIALQAASLPNLAAARAFSEKLVRAGIPAYVVAADLGRRGTWYRVRVGRFATSAEAQAYAMQSRQRAKAAGMSIELIVSEYEMPLPQD